MLLVAASARGVCHFLKKPTRASNGCGRRCKHSHGKRRTRLINPAILLWAREKARLTPEVAAKSIGITPESFWPPRLAGSSSFPQFLAMANCYKRAPSLFTSMNRLHSSGLSRIFTASTAGRQLRETHLCPVRQARERRELALDLHEELGTPRVSLSASLEKTKRLWDIAAFARSWRS